MKTVMATLLISLLAVGTVTFLGEKSQANEAQYYRVWQGFKKPNLSNEQFLNILPSFMKDTVDLYRNRGLNNYLVVLPPADRPDFIPDEFALVALTSEDAYRTIRNTEEGKQYGERHWEVFNQENSSSSRHFIDYQTARPKKLDNNWTYDMIGQPVDWSKGYSLVYVGIRQNHLSKAQFLDRLNRHIDLAKETLSPLGMKAYIVLANENYEVAYINWHSKEAHDAAFERKDAQAIFLDAEAMLDTLMYQELRPFVAGSEVHNGSAYSTVYSSSK